MIDGDKSPQSLILKLLRVYHSFGTTFDHLLMFTLTTEKVNPSKGGDTKLKGLRMHKH